jgi:arylsulfatase
MPNGKSSNGKNHRKPNLLVIFGDDIGQTNISAYSHGLMGYRTESIDRLAREGMMFVDYYGEQSCTAGRSAFILGQSPFRSGLSKVGMPGATLGMRPEDPTIAELLKLLAVPTQAIVQRFLATFREFPPRQKAASFTVDQALERLTQGLGST